MSKHTWDTKPTLEKALKLWNGYRFCLDYCKAPEDICKSFAGYYVERTVQSHNHSPLSCAPQWLLNMRHQSQHAPVSLRKAADSSFMKNPNYRKTWDRHEKAGIIPDERWFSSDVLDVTRNILIEGVGVHPKYELMGILGDVLQDSGLSDPDIIKMCYLPLPEALPCPKSPYTYLAQGND